MQQMQNGFNAMGGEQDAGSAPGTQPSQQTLLYQQQQQMMLAMQQVMSNGYGMGGMGAMGGGMQRGGMQAAARPAANTANAAAAAQSNALTGRGRPITACANSTQFF